MGAQIKNREVYDMPLENAPRNHRGQFHPTVPLDEIVRLYFSEGLTATATARRVGLSEATVWFRLNKAGYRLRNRGEYGRKVPFAVILDLHNQGLTIQEIGAATGVGAGCVSQRLRRRGLEPKMSVAGAKVWQTRRRHFSKSVRHKVREMYDAGQSSQTIATTLNVSASWVFKALQLEGCKPRTREESFRLWGKKLTRKERCAIWGDEKQRYALAEGREGKPPRTKNEIALRALLEKRQLVDLTPQKAIGPYNVDFGTDTVAVEIVGDGGYRAKFTSNAERIYFILKSGFHMIEVNCRPFDPLQEAAADKVVAFFKATERLPSSIREYRMVSGSGELLAVFQIDLDNLPGV